MNEDILFEVTNNLAKITLNRPKALNALNGDMFSQLHDQLEKWENDESIKAILVKSNCEKAFCAGGDIRAIYDNKHKSADEISQYFRLEYDVNRLIFHLSKPYIALLHGITMGGGVGISIHGSHCVASDNLKWAMPETIIGFFPDVGSTYYLSRLPDSLGAYLALTGNTLTARNALELNLIKKIVPQHHFCALEKELTETHFGAFDSDVVSKIINSYAEKVEASSVFSNAEEISTSFSFSNIEEIVEALHLLESDWSRQTLEQLQQRSPTSLKVTLHQLQLAKHRSLDEVIEMDFGIAHRMLENQDFYEGVRAAIIDKDKNPRWKPAKLSDVSDDDVNSYFGNRSPCR